MNKKTQIILGSVLALAIISAITSSVLSNYRENRIQAISNELQGFRINSDMQIGSPLTSSAKRRKLRNFNYLIDQANSHLTNKKYVDVRSLVFSIALS